MNRAKSSFFHDLAAETRRLAIWWGSALAILVAIPLLVIVLAQIQWARIIADRFTDVGLAEHILESVAITGIVAAGIILWERLFGNGGRRKKGP
jgi:uncharacterized membrane protein